MAFALEITLYGPANIRLSVSYLHVERLPLIIIVIVLDYSNIISISRDIFQYHYILQVHFWKIIKSIQKLALTTRILNSLNI